MSWPMARGVFALGDLPLQSGGVLRDAKLSWKSHGRPAADGGNVIFYPTSFSAQHPDVEWLIGPDGILDPSRWFIIQCDMFGNGLSTSPSNSNGYPVLVTVADNVRAQRRLLQEHFKVERLACVYGWSMGAQQAYHWAAMFPEAVERIVVNCGSARTAPHNRVFLDGLMAIIESAPEPHRAFGRVYAGWAISQDFYRSGLHLSAFGAPDLETFLRTNWDARFARRTPADLMAHLRAWHAADISASPRYGGNLQAALGGIRARVLLMPGATDLYFRVADNEAELPHLREAKLLPIPSIWGHIAGNPQKNPADAAFIRNAVGDWLKH